MSLILYSSDGSVTQVNEHTGLPKPSCQILISLIDGPAGPATLAVAYSHGGVVYATPETTFQFGNILTVSDPIVSRLVDRVGRAGTLELFVTAKTLNAAEALSAGIIDGVISIDEFKSIVAQINKLSRSSITQATTLVRRQKGLTSKQAMLLERYNFALQFASADQKEGIDAFLKKRQPKFSNNDPKD